MSLEVKVGPVSAPGGTKAWGLLEVCTMASGAALSIPVHVVAGARSGPQLCIVAGQHGDEIRSIGAVAAILDGIDARALTGSVVGVPVANPIAFESGVRCTWMDAIHGDGGNLNRVWPGSADGWITERVADVLWRQVVSKADCVLDLHGDASAPGLSIYYAYAGGTDSADEYSSKCRQLALDFGMELLVGSTEPMSGTSLSSQLREERILQVGCELGDFYGLRALDQGTESGALLRDAIEAGTTGAGNVMISMGMLQGSLCLPSRQAIVSAEVGLKPKHGGLLRSHFDGKDVGRVVRGGTVLGTVVSPYSFRELDQITAPFGETVIIAARGVHGLSRVNPGDYGFYVADWRTVEWVSNKS